MYVRGELGTLETSIDSNPSASKPVLVLVHFLYLLTNNPALQGFLSLGEHIKKFYLPDPPCPQASSMLQSTHSLFFSALLQSDVIKTNEEPIALQWT